MLPFVTLSVLGLTWASQLDTVSIPAHRKLLQLNAPSTVFNRLQYNDTWLNGGWFAEISIGEPPQALEVLLDTGSSDMWVPAAQATKCREHHCVGGAFDPRNSTTFKNAQLPQPFEIRYTDGSIVEGNYSLDTVKFGTAMLPNFTFALADSVDVTPGDDNGPQYGILGLGTKAHEVGACPTKSDHCEGGFEVPTLHDALYNSGCIRSRSYSLSLQRREPEVGNILRGVDKSKFTGPLFTFGTLPEEDGPQKGKYLKQSVQLTELRTQINGSSTLQPSSNVSGEATLDTGSTIIRLPFRAKSMVDSFLTSVPVLRNVTQDLPDEPFVYSNKANVNMSLTFTFGASTGISGQTASITVPFHELVTPAYLGYNASTPQMLNGRPICQVNLDYHHNPNIDYSLLGLPFLHSAYVHYEYRPSHHFHCKAGIQLQEARYRCHWQRTCAESHGYWVMADLQAVSETSRQPYVLVTYDRVCTLKYT